MKDGWSYSSEQLKQNGIKESGKMKKGTCPQYHQLEIKSIKTLLWSSTLGNTNWVTAWVESIKLIKWYQDTHGNLLRFQRNNEIKMNGKWKHKILP